MAKRKDGAPAKKKGAQQTGHNTTWRHASADAGAEPDAVLEVETETRRDPEPITPDRKRSG
jgi:hypothetical protein